MKTAPHVDAQTGALPKATAKILIGFVGDLRIDRDNPEEVFAEVKDILRAPDILYGNLEGPYTESPHLAPSAGIQVNAGAHNLTAYGPAGFAVMTLANNHIVDAGHAAMLETERGLKARGVKTCGAGESLAAARKPAILDAGGTKVAFLAYASVFPMGYEARANVPGLAPMRAYNHCHELYPNLHLPGTPPRLETIPDQTDLANLKEDIAKAREQADLVVASFHWGDFLKPFHLTDHETRTARFCIDHGADLVVGHHHHAVRGMEWYQGKPIMYGLGHFVFELRLPPDLLEQMAPAIRADPNYFGVGPREGWPLLPLHPDTRMTMVAWATVESGKVTDIGFLPCWLQPNAHVVPFDPSSAQGAQVVEYVRKCCTTQRLNGRIVPGGPSLAGHPTVRVVPDR